MKPKHSHGTGAKLILFAVLACSASSVCFAQDWTSVDFLYGRNDKADQYGVQYLDVNTAFAGNADLCIGVLSVIDRRYEKYTSADLELGLRIAGEGDFQPWIGLVGTFGFSATREKGSSEYENKWQAGVAPGVGLTIWLSGSFGVEVSGLYLVTTDGSDENCWLAGVGLGLMGN